MAELTINGKTVTVDDSFRDLPPDQQEATVNEIASQMGISPTVAQDEKPEDSWRGEVAAGLRGVRKSLPFGQDIGAAAEAIRKGTSFEEEKKAQVARDVALAEQYPGATLAGEVGGFFVPGFGMAGPMAKAEQAVATRLAPKIGETAARIAGAGAAGAGAGAIQGVGEGVTPEERLTGAVSAAGIGALGGAALPAAGAAVKRSLNEAELAAQRLGVKAPRYVTSEAMLPKTTASALEAVPVTGGIIQRAAREGIEQLGEATERIPGVSPLVDRYEAGAAAKQALTGWAGTRSENIVSKAYDAVDKYINPSIATPLSNTASTIQEIGAKNLLAALPEETAATKLLMDAATNPQGLTYEGIKFLRTHVGQKMKDALHTTGVEQAELKRLYGSLTRDLRDAVEKAGGQRGLTAFERANTLNAQVQAKREQLYKIVGAAGDAPPEAVFDKIYKMGTDKAGSNIDLLRNARTSIKGSDWEDVTSGIINTMGRDAEGAFSPDRFVTAYGKLSDRGKDLIFGGSGNPVRQAMEDINLLSSKYKQAAQSRNVSKAAPVLLGAGALLGLATGTTGIGGTAAGILGTIPVAMLLANPKTAKTVSNFIKKPSKFSYNALLNAARLEAGEPEEDRSPRAGGGRVYPAKKLSLMEKAARKAFNDIALESRPLMDMPDEAIVKALDLAKDK